MGSRKQLIHDNLLLNTIRTYTHICHRCSLNELYYCSKVMWGQTFLLISVRWIFALVWLPTDLTDINQSSRWGQRFQFAHTAFWEMNIQQFDRALLFMHIEEINLLALIKISLCCKCLLACKDHRKNICSRKCRWTLSFQYPAEGKVYHLPAGCKLDHL